MMWGGLSVDSMVRHGAEDSEVLKLGLLGR